MKQSTRAYQINYLAREISEINCNLTVHLSAPFTHLANEKIPCPCTNKTKLFCLHLEKNGPNNPFLILYYLFQHFLIESFMFLLLWHFNDSCFLRACVYVIRGWTFLRQNPELNKDKTKNLKLWLTAPNSDFMKQLMEDTGTTNLSPLGKLLAEHVWELTSIEMLGFQMLSIYLVQSRLSNLINNLHHTLRKFQRYNKDSLWELVPLDILGKH